MIQFPLSLLSREMEHPLEKYKLSMENQAPLFNTENRGRGPGAGHSYMSKTRYGLFSVFPPLSTPLNVANDAITTHGPQRRPPPELTASELAIQLASWSDQNNAPIYYFVTGRYSLNRIKHTASPAGKEAGSSSSSFFCE